MGKGVVRTILVLLALLGSSFAINVTVSSPSTGSAVNSPATITASASSTNPITGWHVYVDSVDAFVAGAVQSIAPTLALPSGARQIIVRAWDSTGAYASASLLLNVSSTASNTVSVNVTAPTGVTTVTSPVTFSASAASGFPVTGWRIYVDGIDSYSGSGGGSMATSLPMSPGSHNVVIRAWNSTGTFGSASLTVNVAASGTGPVPSSGAMRWSNLEATNNWFKCSSASCSGGIAAASNYWVAPYQTSPSLNGASAGFFIAGPSYSTALFAAHFGPTNVPSRFIFEFDVYTDQATYSAAQALEFDLFQVAGHRKYIFGTECDYVTQRWDVWDEVAQRWIPSNAACNKFQPGTWHHVKWAVERVGDQSHYLSVTVDGITQAISDTYAYQPSIATNWDEGALAFQVQQDLGSQPGSGFEVWLNQVNVYGW
jgi:hypothetical protein